MILCETCIHREICAERDCMDEDDERALTYCAFFLTDFLTNTIDFLDDVKCEECSYGEKYWRTVDGEKTTIFYCRYFGKMRNSDVSCPCGIRRDNHYDSCFGFFV